MIHKKSQRHFFEVTLAWEPGRSPVLQTNQSSVTKTASPWGFKDFNNDYWYPENLVLAGFSLGYLESLHFQAEWYGLHLLKFSSTVVAQLEIDNNTKKWIDINFYPKIEINADSLAGAGTYMLNGVQQGCQIADLLKMPVLYHPVLINNKNGIE